VHRPNLKLVRQAGIKEAFTQEVDRAKVPMTTHLGIASLAKQTVRDARVDHVGAFAGNLAFTGVLAIFPFFLFLLSVLAVFHLTQLVHAMLAYARSTVPGPAYHMLRDQVVPLSQSHEIGAFTLGAAVSVLFALWSLTWAFSAITDAMNTMYDVTETRPLWLTYLVSVVMSIVTLVLLVSALVLVNFGSTIADALAQHLRLGAVFSTVWGIILWPVLIYFVLLAFALIYWAAPNVKQSFKLISPGSVVGVTAWLLFSVLFSQYINRSDSYSSFYGAFAGMIVLLLYLYYSSYILLFGAEINVVIQGHAPEHHNQQATVPGDTRPSATQQAKTRGHGSAQGDPDGASTSVDTPSATPT